MSKLDDFLALTKKADPLHHELADIRMEMVNLSAEMTEQIVRDAFPIATVHTLRIVSEIKPSDFAKSANEAVRLLRENRIEPTTIIVDTARKIVLLGIGVLPPAAKATPKKHQKESRQRKGKSR